MTVVEFMTVLSLVIAAFSLGYMLGMNARK
jgi:hypothetical protein